MTINLHSDAATSPTPGMREAIARAEVGDEQRRLDPTTSLLEERVAALLGHETAVFLPSGTMCNVVALLVHVRPGGDEVVIDMSAHPVNHEVGGSRELIEDAWRFKQMLGGALRQSGIAAAACLYALDHHVERLAQDHAHARRLGEGLAAIRRVRLDPAAVETNIVMFEVDDARELTRRVAPEVDLQALDDRRIRAVTHLDLTTSDIDRALLEIERAVRQ